MNKLTILAAGALFAAVLPAQAQVLSERNVSLELANRIAAAAVKACADNGYAVSATVVDRAGVVRAVQRADKAGTHTLDSSAQKAFTSASTRSSTTELLETSQKYPAATNLKDIPGFLLLGGGMPIKAGEDVIGAVGVGGAPGGHLDDACVAAALEQVADQLK